MATIRFITNTCFEMADKKSKKRKLVLDESSGGVILNENHSESIPLYLEIIDEKQIFSYKSSSEVAEAIAQVNHCLTVKADRPRALPLLRLIIAQCPAEIFAQYGEHWASALVQSLQMPSGMNNADILQTLLSKLPGFPQQFRHFSNNILPGLMSFLANSTIVENLGSRLQLILNCMKHLPGPCGSHRNKLEQFVLPLIDNTNIKIQKLAVQCLVGLPGLGGGGNHGQLHRESWSLMVNKLLSALHTTLDTLYRDYETDGTTFIRPPENLITLTSLPTDEPMCTRSHLIRFRGLSFALDFMLRSEFHVSIVLPIDDIMDLISRVLDVRLILKSSRQRHLLSSVIEQSSVLLMLHQSAIQLMEGLIWSARDCLWDFKETVFRCLVTALNSTQKTEKDAGFGQYRKLRGQVYSTLETCFSLDIVCSSRDLLTSIVQHAVADSAALYDVQPLAKLDSLEMTYSKKKRKNKGHHVSEVEEANAEKFNQEAVESLCISALKVMDALIISDVGQLGSKSDSDMQNIFDPIWNRCIPVLLKDRFGNLPVPYNNIVCRRQLYEILSSSVLRSVFRKSQFYNAARLIFSNGRINSDSQIRKCCNKGLATCDMENVLVRPSESPANFETLANASIPNAPFYDSQNQSFSGFGNLNSRSTFSPAVENDIPSVSREDQEDESDVEVREMEETEKKDIEVDEMETENKDTIEVDEASLDVEFEHFHKNDKKPQCEIESEVHEKETKNDKSLKESILQGTTDAIANQVEQIQPLPNGKTDESSRIDSREKQDDEDMDDIEAKLLTFVDAEPDS